MSTATLFDPPKRAAPSPEYATEGALYTGLRTLFPSPEYAVIRHVGDGTSVHKTRTADAVAMGLWKTRGIELHGFEIKISRSDWLREKDDPAKAEAIARFCDRWWLVVSDPSIVRPGELPPTWGLITPAKGKLARLHDAQKLSPEPITRAFLAGLFRALANNDPQEEVIRARVQAAQAEWERDHDDDVKRETSQIRRSLETLQKSVADFEAASGIRIGAHDGRKLGEAVARVLRGDDGTRKLAEAVNCLRWAHENLGKALDEAEKQVRP